MCYLSLIPISGSHGQLDFVPSTTVSSLCKADEFIIATVPAPPKNSETLAQNTISSLLADPIQSQISSMLQAHVRTIHDSFIQRLEEAVKVERGKREEALEAERLEREKREETLKVALKAEREKRKEALKAEREKREEALKAEREKREEALKAEREKREEALKEALDVEREKREEERARDRAERQLEKAEAEKKYERLKDHLLEVEETTLDTVGWIANNVSRRLFNFRMKTDCANNRIPKCLTESSYAICLTKRRKFWPLPPD
jgi:hypothetical protein